MKAIITMIIMASMVSMASASTGSTSTGSTSTGTVVHVGGGGPVRAYNLTKKAYEMYPQCFPWIHLSDFGGLSWASALLNQNVCRKERLEQFGF